MWYMNVLLGMLALLQQFIFYNHKDSSLPLVHMTLFNYPYMFRIGMSLESFYKEIMRNLKQIFNNGPF